MNAFTAPPPGWHNDQKAVWDAVDYLEAKTDNGRAVFRLAAPSLIDQAADDPVFFWEGERKVLGGVLGSWHQLSVGSCVSFGCGRAVQDLILWEIAAGASGETWPGHQVATEPIYGGSRVEIGGGALRGRGDGSVGAWAARWVKEYGVLIRKQYTVGNVAFDLTSYDEERCRLWGEQGCPDQLEPEARLHPVTAVAMVQNAGDLWAAIGGGKPCSVASNQGFTTTLVDGFCSPQGEWAHQMCFRGRFVHPTRGRSFVIQNSWGKYLSGAAQIRVQTAAGQQVVDLPDGCFGCDWETADRMVRQQDSFAYAGMKGWQGVKLTWNPLA